MILVSGLRVSNFHQIKLPRLVHGQVAFGMTLLACRHLRQATIHRPGVVHLKDPASLQDKQHQYLRTSSLNTAHPFITPSQKPVSTALVGPNSIHAFDCLIAFGS